MLEQTRNQLFVFSGRIYEHCPRGIADRLMEANLFKLVRGALNTAEPPTEARARIQRQMMIEKPIV